MNKFKSTPNPIFHYIFLSMLYEELSQPYSPIFPTGARTLLTALKTAKLPKYLTRKENITTLHIDWTDFDKDPSENQAYLDDFCERFRLMMERLIKRCAQQADELNRDPYVVEVIQHLTMCKTRVEVFRGRQDIIRNIEAYVTGACQDPMVLYGISGSGKTSVIAKAFSLVNSWLPNVRPVTMLRFLGEGQSHHYALIAYGRPP